MSKELGVKVKSLREAKGWSLTQMVTQVEKHGKFSRSTLINIEGDKLDNGPSANSIELLAKTFNIDTAELSILIKNEKVKSQIQHSYIYNRILYGGNLLGSLDGCQSLKYIFDFNIDSSEAIDAIKDIIEKLNSFLSRQSQYYASPLGFVDPGDSDLNEEIKFYFGRLIALLNGHDIWIFSKWYLIVWPIDIKHPLKKYEIPGVCNWTICTDLMFVKKKSDLVQHRKHGEDFLLIKQKDFAFHNSKYQVAYINEIKERYTGKFMPEYVVRTFLTGSLMTEQLRGLFKVLNENLELAQKFYTDEFIEMVKSESFPNESLSEIFDYSVDKAIKDNFKLSELMDYKLSDLIIGLDDISVFETSAKMYRTAMMSILELENEADQLEAVNEIFKFSPSNKYLKKQPIKGKKKAKKEKK